MSKQHTTTSSSSGTRGQPFHQTHFSVERLRHGFPREAWNAVEEVMTGFLRDADNHSRGSYSAPCCLTRTFHKHAMATHLHPVWAYATEPGLTTRALQAVMDQIESQITARLKQWLGE